MPDIRYFPYFGPNRRSDLPVVEISLDFTAGEEPDVDRSRGEVEGSLREAGILDAGEPFPAMALPGDGPGGYGSLLAQTALLLQRKAGHRVNHFETWCEPELGRCMALVEHEHCDVGMTAVKLAVEVVTAQRRELTGPWRMFREFARQRLLPLETEAIMNAARRRGIPCVHLERHPFARKPGQGPCVRRNGMLMLGHGPYGRVLDGTFCADRADDFRRALLRNPGQRVQLLHKLGMAVCPDDASSGEILHAVAVNGRVWTLAGAAVDGARRAVEPHDSVTRQALGLHEELGRAPLVLTFRTPDPSRALAETGGGALDFDLAPPLDDLFGADGMGPPVEALLDWLFPPGSRFRMPVIAVTGTNGKTTTCRMISHILHRAGLKPGLVCTNGVFLNGRRVNDADSSSRNGHLEVLTSREVDAAVLETHHRGIMIRGFAFDDCEVGVCLNVTEDHLGEATGIRSVEEMAVVKRALVERASGTAILNADDAHCMAMPGHLRAGKLGLVSMERSADELRKQAGGRPLACCVLERVDGREWMVLHAGGRRLPVIPVERIPATFDGTARFMVCNAMHAALAAQQLGIDVQKIAAALAIFSTGRDTTPGRLNVFDDLPFRVIMDFAHNPDGMRRLAEFADGQATGGRKIVAFAGTAGRPDDMHRRTARSLAGHFDLYVCKEYAPRDGFEVAGVAPVLKSALVESGVDEHRIMVTGWGREAVFAIFDACEPGDLLFLLLGFVEQARLHGWIREYAALHQL